MLCSEIMKTDVECVTPQTPLRDAARAMRDREIGFLPVCDDSMSPVGAITDRDIAVRAVAVGLSDMAPVATCMTREVIACDSQDDFARARGLMEFHHKSRIMCTGRDARLEGVISLSDIADIDEESGAHLLHEVSRREVRGDSMRQTARGDFDLGL